MLKTNFCDYSDAYILVEGTMTVVSNSAATANVHNTKKK